MFQVSRFRFQKYLAALRMFLCVLCCFIFLATEAQDFKRQYKNAKDFYLEGKYNLAMESFKPLLSYDKNNPYTEYACFYYAQAAVRQNYRAVAKDMLLQIKRLYPAWDQMNEVNYWLAKVYFDQREYFQAMHVLKEVKQEDFIETEEIGRLKRNYLFQITDPEILRMMWEDYPQDADVGKSLAQAIGRQPNLKQDKVLFDSVISYFRLSREQYVAATALPTIVKDAYNVSVLFPFLASTLDPSPNKKQNQPILDMYEGMRMANDTLQKKGTHINLLAYDTERNPDVIKRLLESEELKNTDLIVGPVFREEFKVVQQFSEKHHINIINPVTNYSEFTGQNRYALLYQPSLETLGAKPAELLAARTRNKKCMVFYGEFPKDSIMAANFFQRARELGLEVVWSEQFRKETAERIIAILNRPTEFDEFKNPKQFSMKLDSIGSIFVASDNALIYTKVISSVEARGDSILIVGSEAWLDNSSVDLSKYEKLNVMFSAPNYTPLRQPTFMDFRKKFIKSHGSYPPEYMNYHKMGFDFMMFIGQALKKYGVFFQEGLVKDGMLPGWFSKGYRLSPNRDNQEVPFVYFHRGELLPIE